MALSVDCGGGGVKALVLDREDSTVSRAVRISTPYLLSPEKPVETIAPPALQLSGADRMTVGILGTIRHGIVIATSYYITKGGPRSRVPSDPAKARDRFDMGAAVSRALGIPSLALNGIEAAEAGVVTGRGLEMIVTLGTGSSNAVFGNEALAPHVEALRGPVYWGSTYNDYIGKHEHLRLGDVHRSRQVRRVVDALRPVYLWDRLYLGDGNSRWITAAQLTKVGDNIVMVPNETSTTGDARHQDTVRS